VEAFLDVPRQYAIHGMPASLTTQSATVEHVIIINKWLGQSKLLANRLVEKLPEISSP
jgi:hypothetical protein